MEHMRPLTSANCHFDCLIGRERRLHSFEISDEVKGSREDGQMLTTIGSVAACS